MLATEKVTLTLPTELVAAVRRMAPARRQSQFIAEAIRAFLAEHERKILRERLIAGYQANASADAALAAEWAFVDAEGAFVDAEGAFGEDEAWLNSLPSAAERGSADDAANPAR